MREKDYPQIEFVADNTYERNYCYVPQDAMTRLYLSAINFIANKLEQDLNIASRERYLEAHMWFWRKLPDYYKSELADATHMEAS